MADFEEKRNNSNRENLLDDNSEALETDFYTFLNVSRTASLEEIVNAYRRLSKLYHPDKHFDPNRKKDAELLFGKTKQAYEVLSDPHKRAIYDTLGRKGLETEGWEVVQRTKTPQEIREEYERLAREREYDRLQQRTNPKGSISVVIDATELFESYEFENEEPSIFPRFEISSMSIAQSIEAPLSAKNTFILSGGLSNRVGTGSGTISCHLNHLISEKSRAEFEISAGNGLTFSIKGFRTLTNKCFANVRAVFLISMDNLEISLVPSFQTVLARKLSQESMSYLIFKSGRSPSLTSTIVRENSKHRFSSSLQLKVPNSFIGLNYSRKFETKGQLKTSIRYGTFGIVFKYGCEKRISEQSILGASLTVGTSMGVTLTLKLMRANQSYVFPILLSEEILPTSIFYGSIAPLIGWYALKSLIIDPYNERQKQSENQKSRERNASRLAERQREATAAVELMREAYIRITNQEQEKAGLVIIKAFYGNIIETPDELNFNEEIYPEAVDVTISLQCLVKNSTLVLTDSSKCSLPGFYDPCLGEEKSLTIEYNYRNLTHRALIKDNEALKIPKDNHLVRT